MAHSQSIDRKSRNLLVGLAVFLALIHVQIPGLFAAPIESRSSMRIPVRQGTKWGYIDGTGKLVIPFQFDHAFGFSEGLAQVEIDGKCGFIGVQGDLRIPYRSCYLVDDFREGFAAFSNKWRGKRWYIDTAGRDLTGARFYLAHSFSEGLAAVLPVRDGRWGYIDKMGRFVIDPRFEDFPHDFSEGLAGVKLGGKVGFIDKSGEIVIRPQFDQAGDFAGGLAPVAVNGKWGFIDHAGKWVIKPKFDYARHFSNGLAMVQIGNKCGFIDTSGKMIVGPKYDQAAPFEDGYAEVVNGTVGYIDTTGREVLPVKFSEAGYLGQGLWSVMTQGEIRIIDAKQEVIYSYDARDPNCVRQNPKFPKDSEVSVSVEPVTVTVRVGQTAAFQSALIGFTAPSPSWDTLGSPDAKVDSGCGSMTAPDPIQCPYGAMIRNKIRGPKRNIRESATYYPPSTPGKYYVVYDAWQSEGCNGSGFLEKRALAEVTVLP
jgi:hypothetical protein